MKKILITLIVLMTCCFAFASTNSSTPSTSNLTTDQVNSFTSQAIYIQTQEDTAVYTNLWNYKSYGYSNPVDFFFDGRSYVYTETKLDWTAYQGALPLTKDEFYNIVGLPEEAARYLAFKRSRNTWSSVTVGTILGGVACALGGSLLTEGTVSNCLYLASGLCLLTASVGFIMLDIVLVEEDQFSVSMAMNAAQNYNISLLATVSTN
jgi:uncharacterized protein YxeA